MAHAQHLQFVEITAGHLADDFSRKCILEIGSYNVNGSIRPYFAGSTYTGVDLIPGPDVDVVCEGEKLADPDESYDLAVSCECFEHNPQWLETFLNMYRMTKAGGIVIFTCATTGRLEHGTIRTLPESSPGTLTVGWNYYRNLKERDFTSRIEFEKLFTECFFVTNKSSQDLYFIGCKRGGKSIFRFDPKSLASEYYVKARKLQAHLDAQSPYPAILRILSKASLSPLKVAQYLPDPQYQNVALAYIKAFSSVRRPVQQLYRRFRANGRS
jgi:SAM-dependent methyltransferase